MCLSATVKTKGTRCLCTAHGPTPRRARGALSTLNCLAGPIRSSHMVVRSMSISMMPAALGWVAGTGTVRPRPERAVKVKRRGGRMVVVGEGWLECRVGW